LNGKLILVTGCPAAGKSTFAKELARRLRIPCFNKDDLNEVQADAFGPENAGFLRENKRGSAATFKVLLYIAERFLQTGNACILESNFQFIYPPPMSEHAQLEALAARYHAECLTFVFTGNTDVLCARYRERERHWIHELSGDWEAFRTNMKRACENNLSKFNLGKTVMVDTTVFTNVDFEALYETARVFLI
jgi:predicted kinase